jgi:hypothetical protein
MTSILAFIPAVAMGLLLVLLSWPGPYRRDLLLKCSLSLAIGPGLVSCLYFGWCLILRPRSRAYFLAEFLLLGMLLVLVWTLRGRKATQAPLFPDQKRPGKIAWLLLGAFSLTLLVAGTNFILQTLMQPHGIQDAWNIWNMRARFMFRGGPGWTDLFSPNLYWLNHPDYPFLVTAGTARAWSFVGTETTLVPTVQAALYALALIGLLTSAVATKRGWDQGAVAALILAGSPIFVLLTGWQIADVPLAFFLTASVFLFSLVLEHPRQPGLHFLFGLCVGLAAWSKNEGIPWLILCLVTYAAWQSRERKLSFSILKDALYLLAGLALPLANLLYLKLVLAPASDLFVSQTSGSLLERFMDPQRYFLTLTYGLKALAGFSPIGLAVLPTLPLLALYLVLFLPPKEDRSRLRILAYPAAVVLLQGVGYFIIYLITPHDLIWHLRTAVDRLVFHLTPPILLLISLSTRSPSEVFAAWFSSKGKTNRHSVKTTTE